MDTPNFKVLVRCFTYNQSKYITDSMNGFCMQQTDFPFICCIVDDASTDGEQDVIKQYVEENFDFSEGSEAYHKETDYAFITYARHKTNKNCYFAVLYLKENHYSNPAKFAGKKREYLKEWSGICKYEALCEGDDYWTDPYKLQKQVNIMESDKKVMMVYTAFDTVDEDCTPVYRFDYDYNMKISKSGFVFPSFIFRNVAMTVSCMFRREVFTSDIRRNCKVGLDYLYFLSAAALGDVVYLNDKTCNYRKASNSLTNAHGEKVRTTLIYILDYVTELYENGKIPMSKVRHFKTRTYIAAKGIDLVIKRFGWDFLRKHCMRSSTILYLPIGLLLNLKLNLCYYISKFKNRICPNL